MLCSPTHAFTHPQWWSKRGMHLSRQWQTVTMSECQSSQNLCRVFQCRLQFLPLACTLCVQG